MTEYAEVAPSDLTPNPLNPRRDLGDLGELADSIVAQGVIEPVVAFRDAEQSLVILAGHRRAAAAVKAGVAAVPVRIVEQPAPGEQLALMLVENGQRCDLTATEEAQAFGGLVDAGWKQTDIVKRTGRSPGHVSKRLALLKLPDEVLDKVDDGTIPLDRAVELARIRNPKVVTKLTKRGDPEPWALSAALDVQDREDAAVADRAELEKAGVVVVDETQLRNGTAAVLAQDVTTHRLGKVHAVAFASSDHGNMPCDAVAVLAGLDKGEQTVAVCVDPASHGVPVVKLEGGGWGPLTVARIEQAAKEAQRSFTVTEAAKSDDEAAKQAEIESRERFEKQAVRAAERRAFLSKYVKTVGLPSGAQLLQHAVIGAAFSDQLEPDMVIASRLLGEEGAEGHAHAAISDRIRAGGKSAAQASQALAASGFEYALFAPSAETFDELAKHQQQLSSTWSTVAWVPKPLMAAYLIWLAAQGFPLSPIETDALANCQGGDA